MIVADEQTAPFQLLREYRERKPFIPYTITTKDGNRCRFRAPLAVAMNSQGIVGYAEGHRVSIRVRWDEVDRIEQTPSEWATMDGDYLC